MISDSVKVNEREVRGNSINEREINHTAPDLHNQPDDMFVAQNKKHSLSQNKEYDEKVESFNQVKQNSVSFNSYKDPNSAKHYSTKAQSSIATYGVNAPKKTGNTNFSYSSRPKTTMYLTTSARPTEQSKPKVNNFLTHSMDGTQNQNAALSSTHSPQPTQPVYSVNPNLTLPPKIEEPISSARYSRSSKNQSRGGNSNTATLSVSKAENAEIPESRTGAIKTYRGPFSVSCTTTKEPSIVMNDMLKSLDLYSVTFQRLSNFFVK